MIAAVLLLAIGAMALMYRRGEDEEMFSEEPPPESNYPKENPPE